MPLLMSVEDIYISAMAAGGHLEQKQRRNILGLYVESVGDWYCEDSIILNFSCSWEAMWLPENR